MKRQSIVLVTGITVCVGFGVSACDSGGAFWERIKSEVERGRTEILISEVANYDWDKVCVLPPYALNIGGKHARLREYLPFELGEFEGKIPALEDDGEWSFAFVKGEKVIALEKRGRGPGLMFNGGENNCIDHSVARLVIQPTTPHGDAYLLVTGERVSR